jgi:hypothetical protein
LGRPGGADISFPHGCRPWFESQRAAALLHSGAALADRLPGRIALVPRLVVAGRLRILRRLEQTDYDVFLT